MCEDDSNFSFSEDQIQALIKIAAKSTDPNLENEKMEFDIEELTLEVVEATERVLYDIKERIEIDEHYINSEAKEYAQELKELLLKMPRGISLYLLSTNRFNFKLIEHELTKELDSIIECKIPHIKTWKVHLIKGVEHICRVGSLKFTSSPDSAAHCLISVLCESLNKEITTANAKELIIKYKKNKKSFGLV